MLNPKAACLMEANIPLLNFRQLYQMPVTVHSKQINYSQMLEMKNAC